MEWNVGNLKVDTFTVGLLRVDMISRFMCFCICLWQLHEKLKNTQYIHTVHTVHNLEYILGEFFTN
jgi:hypothetical protein